MIGLSPSIFIHVSIGSGLNSLLDENIEAKSNFFLYNLPELYLPIIGLIFLILIPRIIKNKILKKNKL